MKEYLAKINSFIERLDNDTLSALKDISQTKIYKKGKFLLRQDEVCRYSFTIQEGQIEPYILSRSEKS